MDVTGGALFGFFQILFFLAGLVIFGWSLFWLKIYKKTNDKWLKVGLLALILIPLCIWGHYTILNFLGYPKFLDDFFTNLKVFWIKHVYFPFFYSY